ncbi:MAG: CinA family protein [Alphaproteobacteria bacterium]|nr:CinA family protein [Alphaproteobacteria bacterium]
MSDNATYATAINLLDAARAKGLRLAAAESCTGGLIAASLTEIAGASDVFERGFVTYSNEAKRDMLGVPRPLIERHGAVSAEVVHAMAQGAIDRSLADIAIAVTGVAGPGGGSAEKPVGLVHFACARRGGGVDHVERRFGPLSRAEIRAASVAQALDMMRKAVAAA